MSKPKLKIPPLEQLQKIAWQLHYLAERIDGPAKAVLERARDDITSIASEVYGD
jgi:hypothetical protein